MFETEERRIVERIKDFIKREKPPENDYIMLRDGRILNIGDYYRMINSGKVNPQDAYVYIRTNWSSKTAFYYPFICWYWYDGLFYAYLSKLGFYYYWFTPVPATGLKYVAAVVGYGEYLSIEVTNLDTAVNNLNLPRIVVEVLGDKIISGENKLTDEEYEKIRDMFRSQRLFAGYDADEAYNIIYDYYNKGNQSLTKEAARITMDYYRIFNPYKVCYETRTWKEVDCWSIKL